MSRNCEFAIDCQYFWTFALCLHCFVLHSNLRIITLFIIIHVIISAPNGNVIQINFQRNHTKQTSLKISENTQNNLRILLYINIFEDFVLSDWIMSFQPCFVFLSEAFLHVYSRWQKRITPDSNVYMFLKTEGILYVLHTDRF